MIPFFLSLNFKPVAEAVQTLVIIIIGKVQIQIRGVEFFVDLVV